MKESVLKPLPEFKRASKDNIDTVHMKSWRRNKLNFLILVLGFIGLCMPAIAQDVFRSAWEISEGRGVIAANFQTNEHGDIRWYDLASIPSEADASWRALAANEIVDGNVWYNKDSILSSCYTEADFTYLQSFIDIPYNAELTQFEITFNTVDDGVRAYIYNDIYPNGQYVPGSELKLGQTSITNDLSSIVTTGINRVVLVQVDDCAVLNNLENAQISIAIQNQAPVTAVIDTTMVVDPPAVTQTSTGGSSWQQTSGTLVHVSTVDYNIAWGVNASGNVYVTRDGGQSWQQPNANARLTYISALNFNTAWGININGNIYRTVDSGQTWQQVSGLLTVVSAIDIETAWGVNASGNIYRTTDGGQSWQQVSGSLTVVSAIDYNTAWGVDASGNIYRTSDGGQSWQQTSGALTYITVIDYNTAWGVNASDNIYWTVDGGQTWTQFSGRLVQISGFDNNILWGVNASGNIYRMDTTSVVGQGGTSNTTMSSNSSNSTSSNTTTTSNGNTTTTVTTTTTSTSSSSSSGNYSFFEHQATGGYEFDLYASGSSAFTLVGNAQFAGNGIRLTSASSSQFGGAFYNEFVSIKDFTTSFAFRMSEPGGNFTDCLGATGADGIVFVMQSIDPVVDPTALGGSIGYEGIPYSIGIEFDSWCNPELNDPDSNHVSVHMNGVINEQPYNTPIQLVLDDGSSFSGFSGNYMPIQGDFYDGAIWYVTIEYDSFAGGLIVTIGSDSTAEQSLFFPMTFGDAFLRDLASIGFTSATGGAWGNHDILEWFHSAGTPERVDFDGNFGGSSGGSSGGNFGGSEEDSGGMTSGGGTMGGGTMGGSGGTSGGGTMGGTSGGGTMGGSGGTSGGGTMGGSGGTSGGGTMGGTSGGGTMGGTSGGGTMGGSGGTSGGGTMGGTSGGGTMGGTSGGGTSGGGTMGGSGGTSGGGTMGTSGGGTVGGSGGTSGGGTMGGSGGTSGGGTMGGSGGTSGGGTMGGSGGTSGGGTMGGSGGTSGGGTMGGSGSTSGGGTAGGSGGSSSVGSVSTGSEIQVTNWELHEGRGPVPLAAQIPYHGHPAIYDEVLIPFENDSGWRALAVDETNVEGDINFSKASELPTEEQDNIFSCWNYADFTYIQAFLEIPASVQFTAINLHIESADDVARAYVFNSQYPEGVYIEGNDIVLEDGPIDIDLTRMLVRGERNRVVVAQADDCLWTNALLSTYMYVSLNSTGGASAGGEIIRGNSSWSGSGHMSGGSSGGGTMGGSGGTSGGGTMSGSGGTSGGGTMGGSGGTSGGGTMGGSGGTSGGGTMGGSGGTSGGGTMGGSGSSSGGGQWQQVSGTLKQVTTIDYNVAWGVHSSGEIYRTTDGGQSWQLISGRLEYITATDSNTAWGVNASGEIFRTSNGGQSWQQVSGSLKQVIAIDFNTAWGVQASGSIYRTNSGGQSWQQVSGTLASVSAIDYNTAWGVNASGNIYRTSNGGESWQQTSGSLSQVSAFSYSVAWGVNSFGSVYWTVDGGQSWTQFNGTLVQISGYANNILWGVDGSGNIFRIDTSGITDSCTPSNVYPYECQQLLQIEEEMQRGAKYGMNGHYITFQSDNNFCVYRNDGTYVWCLNTLGVDISRVAKVWMQEDGNFGAYDANNGFIWTMTNSYSDLDLGNRLILTPEGELQLYSDAQGRVLWSSQANPGMGIKDVVWAVRGFGDMTFNGEVGQVRGNYNTDNGVIIGEFNGLTFTGKWVEDQASYACSTAVDNRYYWGGFEIVFNADRSGFEGKWGYCDEPLDRDFTATRK